MEIFVELLDTELTSNTIISINNLGIGVTLFCIQALISDITSGRKGGK